MNNYEASNVVSIGEARELILGTKPASINADNEFVPLSLVRQQDDIDETDE